jgi:hypothetical protein
MGFVPVYTTREALRDFINSKRFRRII